MLFAGGFVMYKCAICGAEFEKEISLKRHVSVSFAISDNGHLPWLVYLNKYCERKEFSKKSLRKMYETEMMSTPMISKKLGLNKQTLLRAMHYYGIHLRSASEASKNQFDRDGIWNKGLTKNSHPSIKQYADSRRGKNNPYWTAPGLEERRQKNADRAMSRLQDGRGNRQPKSTELRMVKILDIAGIQYVRNFAIKYKKTWRLYDFLIEGVLAVEMQGNYYHANPKMYEPDDKIVIARHSRKASDIWEYDEKKKQLAIDNGYKYLAIWEKDFVAMSDKEAIQCLE